MSVMCEGVMCEGVMCVTCSPWHRGGTRPHTHRPGNPGGRSACRGSGLQAERDHDDTDCTSSSGISWHWGGRGRGRGEGVRSE